MASPTTSESDVMALSPGAVRGLVESKVSSPSAVSPLTSVLRESGKVPAMAAELGSFRPSLDVAERPQAYVRILIVRPEVDEEVIGLLVRDGQGASFSLADGALHLGRAQPLEVLVGSLASSLVHQGPQAGGEVWLWPTVVQLLTGLWQEQADPATALSRAAVIERLITPEFSAAEAEKFVAGVVANGAVEAAGDQLVLTAGLRPWLSTIWSGHAVQVEYVPLPEDASLEQAIEGPREHLLFVGPPGARSLNEVVTGEALVRQLGGRQPRETSMLHLSAPRAEEIAKRLRELLKIEPLV